MTNEVLFFATALLVPAVIALYFSLAGTDRTKAAAGCGIIAVVIPVVFVLGIVQGRLVYPVYSIQVNTPALAELVVAVYYGGLHAVSILFAIATVIITLAMRRGVYGRTIAYLGFAAGLFDLIGSDSWIIGPVLALVSQVFFAAWFLAAGLRLYKMRNGLPIHGAL